MATAPAARVRKRAAFILQTVAPSSSWCGSGEKLQIQILELRNKLKGSEYRGEQAEMNIQRLNVRIDQVEEDLLQEKLKIKKVSDELDQTFDDMLNLNV